MKPLFKIPLIAAVFSFIWSTSFGQQATSSSGGEYTSGSYVLNYTIGESVIETLTGSKILTQGFQQSKLSTTSIYRHREFGKKFNLYPNPTSSQLNITINNEAQNYSITILNEIGYVLKSEKMRIGRAPAIISFNDYEPGIYYVRIIQEPKIVLETFKVVKL